MKSFLALAPLLAAAVFAPAYGQDLDLGGAPGATPTPVNITASGGITWSQDAQTVTATQNAKAVRGDVTVTADQLVAHYKKAPPAPGTAAAAAPAAPATPDSLEQGGGQLTELDAIGNVHIYTATQNAWGDKAVYSLDAKVLVLTGKHLKLTTPTDTITARDLVEYYTDAHKAIARGNALVVTNDGRSVAADVLTGYLAAAPANAAPAANAAPGGLDAGSLQKVEAVGHVVVRTTTDTATGDTGVYLPPTGQARLGGNVHVIHGPNELAGSDALVNMKTGVATLLAAPGGQVSGVILPNSTPPAGASK